MGKLIYSMNVSLDGFVETPDHSLAWATIDDEIHSWFNEQAKAVDASLYGRRMYRTDVRLLAHGGRRARRDRR